MSDQSLRQAMARVVETRSGEVVDFLMQTATPQQRAAFLDSVRPDADEERARLRRCIEILEGMFRPAQYAAIIASIQTRIEGIR